MFKLGTKNGYVVEAYEKDKRYMFKLTIKIGDRFSNLYDEKVFDFRVKMAIIWLFKSNEKLSKEFLNSREETSKFTEWK